MIPEKALKSAMDAGWKPEVIAENLTHHWFGASQNQTISLANTALDATFWQALGKALGWGDYWYNDPETHVKVNLQKPWLDYAHRFCDLIYTGGDTEKFWDELLKS